MPNKPTVTAKEEQGGVIFETQDIQVGSKINWLQMIANLPNKVKIKGYIRKFRTFDILKSKLLGDVLR